MRRPQGFDGPPRPRDPAPAGETAAPSASARGERQSRTATRERAATTEPIPVQTRDARPALGDPHATQPIAPLEGPAARIAADPDATQPVEPIARTGAGSRGRRFRLGRRPADGAARGPSATEAGHADASQVDPPETSDVSDAGEAPGRSGGATGSAWGDVRAAKRALARARAARKRYERQEVRRFTERTRRRRRAWLIGAGSVVLVTGGLLAVAYSPLMALREVRIEGAARIPAAEIQAAFADDLGTPLPLIGSGDVQSALQGFPLIETYSTETLPPSTLVVRIVERTPVGVIETPDGLALVDAAGVVIERPAERPEGQPLISAGPVTSEGFRAAAAVIRSLPADVRGQVVQAGAETADDVRLVLAGDAAVVWGSAEQSTLKATVLAQLMRSAPPGTVATYDVSAPMSPGLIG